MGAQHHYVSKFHLRQFIDPDSLSQQDPWLWQGFVPDGPVKRRAPKNVGTRTLMFDGPGGLADRESTLESFLANEVEGPAAGAMRDVCLRPRGSGGDLPPALTRYLAWAAARSLPMQQLFKEWVAARFADADRQMAEPPPEGLMTATDPKRDVRMVHPSLGTRTFPHGSDLEAAIRDGWTPDYDDPANFLESVHIQAHYFQTRFFPRLKWFTLHAPDGEFFVMADRAVGWAADGYVNAPPSCLRDPSAYVLAPISRSLVLVGRHQAELWNVTPAQVNAVIAAWAHEWIVGPTEQVVTSAIAARREALADGAE
jgi:hypothetical protein